MGLSLGRAHIFILENPQGISCYDRSSAVLEESFLKFIKCEEVLKWSKNPIRIE
jgi:hypothetical protein